MTLFRLQNFPPLIEKHKSFEFFILPSEADNDDNDDNDDDDDISRKTSSNVRDLNAGCVIIASRTV